jgi:thiol-disulfide isomerase/thioredoxin
MMNKASWVLLAMLLGVVFTRAGQRGGPELNRAAPDIKAPLLSGESFHLNEQRGKVILLDFWATWCPPCRASLPALSAVAERYRGSADVWVGGVNKERLSSQRLRDFLSDMKVSAPVILDRRGQVNARYQVSALPTLVLIGKDGLVKKTQVGLPFTNPDRLAQHLIKLIEEARSAP